MKGNRFLVFTISVCFVLSIAGFSVVACQASGDLDLSLNRDNISIHGIYGRAINYSDIKDVSLNASLPEIKFRSNGFAAGRTRLGNFITKDDRHILLFTYSDTCFIQITTKSGDTFYLSRKQPDETTATFRTLKRMLSSRL